MYVCIYIYIAINIINNDMGRVSMGAAEAIQITTSYKSNARAIHS